MAVARQFEAGGKPAAIGEDGHDDMPPFGLT
jgi:hypothetical protein